MPPELKAALEKLLAPPAEEGPPEGGSAYEEVKLEDESKSELPGKREKPTNTDKKAGCACAIF